MRKNLRLSLAGIIPRYNHACAVLKPLTQQLDLEKYYDIYDVSDVDFSDAMLGYSDTEFEDLDSLRVLKILAARFHTARKIFLCCLMALDANGGKSDYPRWRTAVMEIRELSAMTSDLEQRLRGILSEEESKTHWNDRTMLALTLTRFPCSSDPKITSHANPRAMASPTSETKLSFVWH